MHAQIRARRGRPHVARRRHRASSSTTNTAKTEWNARLKPIRCRIEKILGTCKRSYGLARARYRGRARIALQIRLTFLAVNVKRAAALVCPKPA